MAQVDIRDEDDEERELDYKSHVIAHHGRSESTGFHNDTDLQPEGERQATWIASPGRQWNCLPRSSADTPLHCLLPPPARDTHTPNHLMATATLGAVINNDSGRWLGAEVATDTWKKTRKRG